MLVGIIGGASVEPEVAAIAMEVGSLLAQRGATIVCGGLGGVMEAVCRGAKEHDGTTIGILPGVDPSEANEFVDYPIVTGMAQARNVIIARTAQVLIAIDGRYGTLSEIAYALHFGKPVVGLNTWRFDDPTGDGTDAIFRATSPEDAVALAMRLAKE